MKTKPVIIGLALLVLSTPLLADDDCDGLGWMKWRQGNAIEINMHIFYYT